MVKKEIKLTHSEDYYIRKLLNEVMVKEIMTSPVITVKVDEPFYEVAKKIVEKRVRHVPIIDHHGRVLGLVTQRDLYKTQSPHKNMDGQWQYDEDALSGVVLNDVMTHNPTTIGNLDKVAKAILLMVDRGYGCLPVTDAKKVLVGIVTRADILSIAAQILRE